ncbi:MAG: LysR family transcriptional regulator [Sphingomonadaceae bacterium]|nr:LysR family transcriptional regulator [Sphingomonadaceae bacterium]
MSDAQLRRLDATLLLVFEEAMASGKLSAAARRLGLTQSGISHAVGRLRDIFGDELFIRTAHGVRPTPRAVALRAPIAEALRLMRGALRAPHFDPAVDARVFTIAATDYETAVFAPLLVGAGAQATRFVFKSLVRGAALAALEAGEVDLLLGYTWNRGRGCAAQTLFHEDYLVVGRADHALLQEPIDLDAYVAADHVLVSPGGTLSGIVDASLAKLGRRRRVVLAVPYFLAALATVAETDLIATLPRRLAGRYAGAFGLATAAPPLAVRAFPVHAAWNRANDSDPALIWLRQRIAPFIDDAMSIDPAADP